MTALRKADIRQTIDVRRVPLAESGALTPSVARPHEHLFHLVRIETASDVVRSSMIMDAGEPRISRPGFDRQPPLIQIKQIPDTPSFYRMEGRFHGLAYGSRRRRFGNALAKGMVEPGANPLAKELATYFSTSEARSGPRARGTATL